jgi:hypothetical protein
VSAADAGGGADGAPADTGPTPDSAYTGGAPAGADLMVESAHTGRSPADTGPTADSACTNGTPGDRAALAAARAARLLRWYPAGWRARYGEEFTELLIADIRERPRSAARTGDVARGGIVARLGAAGLAGLPAGAATAPGARNRQVRASLVSLCCAAAVFAGFGAAQWSQLTIGWQWSSSAGTPATVATVLTSAMMLALLALAVLAAVPVLCAIAVRAVRRQGKGLAVPSAVLAAATAAVFAGGRHFGNGWPGTGGHRGLVPAGLAAFEWATSLSVSAYWAHPGALAAFPGAELAWMTVSPLALACAVIAAATLVRRAELTPRLLAFEARLGTVACAAMAVFLAGCSCWVATGGQRSLFHAGLIDVAGVAIMALALGVAQQAARTARRGLSPGPARS